VLILDEPWEGLDAATRDLIPRLVREVTAAGGMVLISDHRGETARLPEASIWAMVDGVVSVSVGDPASRCVVEVEVPADGVATLVDHLRSAGHRVVRVRPEQSEPVR
jgi:ABC-type multidrug transport system ATPase subunit